MCYLISICVALNFGVSFKRRLHETLISFNVIEAKITFHFKIERNKHLERRFSSLGSMFSRNHYQHRSLRNTEVAISYMHDIENSDP